MIFDDGEQIHLIAHVRGKSGGRSRLPNCISVSILYVLKTVVFSECEEHSTFLQYLHVTRLLDLLLLSFSVKFD